jgi:preprotein translocase subunit YajC
MSPEPLLVRGNRFSIFKEVIMSMFLSGLSLFPLLGGAAGIGGGEGGGASGIMSFAPFILIIGIFYFLIIRPQNKKQKETQKMLSALKKGDKVVTIGGIHGTIASVKESTVIVRVDDTIKMEFSRSAISTVTAQKEEKDEDEQDDAAPAADTKKDGKGSKKSGKAAALPAAGDLDTAQEESQEKSLIEDKANE